MSQHQFPPHSVTLIILLFYYGRSHCLFAKLFDSSSWNILSRQWRHGTPPEHYTPDLVLSIPLSVTYLGLVIVTHQIFLSTQRLAKWCILILASSSSRGRYVGTVSCIASTVSCACSFHSVFCFSSTRH